MHKLSLYNGPSKALRAHAHTGANVCERLARSRSASGALRQKTPGNCRYTASATQHKMARKRRGASNEKRRTQPPRKASAGRQNKTNEKPPQPPPPPKKPPGIYVNGRLLENRLERYRNPVITDISERPKVPLTDIDDDFEEFERDNYVDKATKDAIDKVTIWLNSWMDDDDVDDLAKRLAEPWNV